MQDRFKFRVWDKDRKKIFDCIQINFTEGAHGSNSVKYNECSIHLMYQPHLELMQCTGREDKNSKLIFEGDVIFKKGSKNYKGEKMFSEVIWSKESASFMISDKNGLHQMPHNSNNIEIIGNKFETPELLEE